MAFTITQIPTTPNAAYTRLLYAVSGSTNTSKPQYQYIMDVYESGSSDLIKRTTQTINPAGVAIFDPSRIFQGELSDDYSWKISSVTPFDSSSKTFRLEFGEMYAASISSSAGIVDNIARTNTQVFRGVVEPNAGTYNWDSGSYGVLSNMPSTMSMQSDDYGTISVYNDQGTYISQSFYSVSTSSAVYEVVEQKNYTTSGTYFNAVPISASVPYWVYVDVSISSSYGTETYRYEASDETHREKTRFAFVNKLGAWDYYNNYNPVRQAIKVEREQYTAPRVDYSSRVNTYDIERRGLSDYHNSTDDIFTVDTDLLDKTTANWLEELIESPEVYIQRNGEFIPIIITDSNYTSNTNQARQKDFKYFINFKPSNQPFGKWEPEYVRCPGQINNCAYTINTQTTSSFSDESLLMIAQLTASAANNIDEVGFYYSSQSSNPGPGDNVVTKAGVVAPFTDPTFSIDVSGLNSSTTYYYRGYGKSPDCADILGDVVFSSTGAPRVAFDPTLGGTVSPYFWYDFSDTGSMIAYSGSNEYQGITSKGTNTGSLEKGTTLKYSSSYWTPFVGENGYSTFNNVSSKHSTVARKYGTGDFSNDNIFNTGSSFTAISFTQPVYKQNGTLNELKQLISFKASGSIQTDKAEEITFFGFGLTGSIDAGGTGTNLDFISTDTTNFRSMSYVEVEYPDVPFPVTDRDFIAYSYNGTAGGWQSTYQVYNSGSSNTLKIGREPISSSQNFVTGSAIFQDRTISAVIGEGLAIGTRAERGLMNYNSYEFNIAHYIMYDSVLSNEQIQEVVDSYSGSTFLPINAFEN